MSFAQSVLEGKRVAIARLLTEVEDNSIESRRILNELFPSSGRAHLIGITGAPGTGKSSLVNQIALFLRKGVGYSEESPPNVGIIAVDPTSPFSGGAILGDRIRMRELSGDQGVFIRSMASRGSLGGIAAATSDASMVLDAAGFGIILIETVGAGQAEVDIAKLAHTTVVVVAPGFGDEIQAIKAGILEIADILVVNKADLPGAENTERALRGMFELADFVQKEGFSHHGRRISVPNWVYVDNEETIEIQRPNNDVRWITPIQRTIAKNGEGVADLIDTIVLHRKYLIKSGDWIKREKIRLESEVISLLRQTLLDRWMEEISQKEYEQTIHEVYNRRKSPHQAVEYLTN